MQMQLIAIYTAHWVLDHDDHTFLRVVAPVQHLLYYCDKVEMKLVWLRMCGMLRSGRLHVQRGLDFLPPYPFEGVSPETLRAQPNDVYILVDFQAVCETGETTAGYDRFYVPLAITQDSATFVRLQPNKCGYCGQRNVVVVPTRDFSWRVEHGYSRADMVWGRESPLGLGPIPSWYEEVVGQSRGADAYAEAVREEKAAHAFRRAISLGGY